MADEEDEETEEGGGGGSGVMMLGIVGLVGFLLGGGAGFAGHMFLMPCEECIVEADEEGEGAEEAEELSREVHSLRPLSVNLRGTNGGRMLRIEVHVEVDSDKLETITDQSPVLRDAVITLASDYTYADLEGIDGKARFRDELLSRLNGALMEPWIRRIYFTQFMVN